MENKIYNTKKLITLGLSILIFIFVLKFLTLKNASPEAQKVLAVAILMAILWLTESIPICITALLPIVLFPILGIMDGKTIASSYINYIIFLFIGGFIVALAMEKWALHKRIALKILTIVGKKPNTIILGFITSTAFLSMWISNTATAMMMIPIAIAVIKTLEEIFDSRQLEKYSKGLLFAIAYSASIGGIATLVGTPPNIAFSLIYETSFPQNQEVTFLQWFLFALPISITLLIFLWFYLSYKFPFKGKWNENISEILTNEYKKLGKITYEQKIVLIAFIVLAFLWLFRNGFSISIANFNIQIKGWADFFKHPEYLNDGIAPIFISIILFLIPTKDGKSTIVDKQIIKQIPWNIILLFGGGFALAKGFKDSGLSQWIGEQFTSLGDLNLWILVFSISLIISFTTELTSNTATTQMILPILAGISVETGIHPLILMLPATISASLAFMFPVATPPNTIIFSTNKIKISEMVKTGFILNLVGVIITTIAVMLLAKQIFNLS